jgi:DNA-binding CsgD family transcriptional regulator
MLHDVTTIIENVKIVSDNYFYKYGLRKMISLLNLECHSLRSLEFTSSPTIVFRKSLVSICYPIPPADSKGITYTSHFSIDIPFVCDSLSINEVQAKLEKIIILSHIKITAENIKNIHEKMGAKRYMQLSSMENIVLRLIGKGYWIQDISVKLNCSEKTVSTHCRNAMRKMGIVKKSELYHYASWVVQHADKDRITLCL